MIETKWQKEREGSEKDKKERKEGEREGRNCMGKGRGTEGDKEKEI